MHVPITISPLAWPAGADPAPYFAQHTLTWPELVAWFAQCAQTPYESKDVIPLIQYAHTSGAKRADATELHALSLDYDGCTPEQFGQAVAAANALGVAWFGYTSYRHGVYVDPKRPLDTARFRLVFPLARPIPAAHVEAATSALAQLVGVFNSKAPGKPERNPERRWYIPAINPALGSCWFDASAMGLQFANCESLVAAAPVTPADDLPIIDELDQGELVGAKELHSLANKLQRRDAEEHKSNGRAIARALMGEVFAPEGSRNDTTYRICGDIANEFPRAHAETIASLFQAALELQGEPSLSAFVGMLKRQQSIKQSEQARKRREDADREALRAGIRTTAALAAMAREQHCAAASVPLEHLPIILQRANRYWLRRLDQPTYDIARGAEEIGGELLKSYVGAIRVSDDAGKLLPMSRIMADYGCVLDDVAYAYMATSNTWDPQTNALTLRSAKRRKLTPQFSHDVDRWLRALAGLHYRQLEQWLAGILYLDRPAPALYLWGKASAGKSFLALALAALWETPGGSLSEALSDFNACLRNPIVHADEALPARMTFADVREFVTASVRSINEKYGAKLPLRGNVRLLLTANNANLLRLPRNDAHTEDDARAIAMRVLRIKVQDRARDVLAECNTYQWVADHTVARHVLHLHQTVGIDRGRFVVDVQDPEIVSELAGSRYGWFVSWLCGYLDDPGTIETRYMSPAQRLHVRTRDGRLYVHPAALTELAPIEVQRKDHHERERALAYFGAGVVRIGAANYHEIDVEKLLAARGGDVDLALRTLSRWTEDRIGTPRVDATAA